MAVSVILRGMLLAAACLLATSSSAVAQSALHAAPRPRSASTSTHHDPGIYWKRNGCPADSPLSCSVSNTTDTDSCCYEGTNGIFMQTQIWDGLGPHNSFTIHGLWPDACGGGWNQWCNTDAEIENASTVIDRLGLSGLKSMMNTYWLSDDSPNPTFWTHEWNKHGTCMATMRQVCFSDSIFEYDNVGAFYNRVVTLFNSLPTWLWLKDAGIEPSDDATDMTVFVDALQKHTNGVAAVDLDCNEKNELDAVYYYMNLRGSVAYGDFSFMEAPATNCNADKPFYYLPKTTIAASDAAERAKYGEKAPSRSRRERIYRKAHPEEQEKKQKMN